MNGPDYMAAAAALFNAFTFERLIPLVSLFGVASLLYWLLHRASAGGNFDASQFLRDDGGKLSWGRVSAAVALTTHTWFIFTRTLNDKITDFDMGLYSVTWSGSLVLLQFINAWKGKP